MSYSSALRAADPQFIIPHAPTPPALPPPPPALPPPALPPPPPPPPYPLPGMGGIPFDRRVSAQDVRRVQLSCSKELKDAARLILSTWLPYGQIFDNYYEGYSTPRYVRLPCAGLYKVSLLDGSWSYSLSHDTPLYKPAAAGHHYASLASHIFKISLDEADNEIKRLLEK